MGHVGGDLDAFVHRARVHKQGAGFGAAHTGFGDHPPACVFAHRGERAAGVALFLDAKGDDGVGVGDGVIEVVLDGESWRGVWVVAEQVDGDEGRGSAEHDGGSHCGEAEDVGAGDAAVEGVADDDDFLAVEAAEAGAHRHQVEEGLGGMGVASVAGVDDAGAVEVSGEEVGGSGVWASDDDEVGAHCLEGEGGVEERFAFFGAASGAGDVDDVGAEHLAGLFEGDAGSGARFEEDGDDDFSAERGGFFDAAAEEFAHRLRLVEHADDLAAREVVEVEHVLAAGERSLGVGGRRRRAPERCAWGVGQHGSSLLSWRMRATSSTLSISATRTCTSSLRDVGMFLPT